MDHNTTDIYIYISFSSLKSSKSNYELDELKDELYEPQWPLELGKVWACEFWNWMQIGWKANQVTMIKTPTS